MSKNAIITLAVGPRHQSIYNLTRPTIVNYSKKINADFHEITEYDGQDNPKLLKFRIYDYLLNYDRVIYFDSDILINPTCPNLFSLVPEKFLGGVSESRLYFNREEVMKQACAIYGISLRNYQFFNTGVMVISRKHRQLFAKPRTVIPIQGFYDQPYINALFLKLHFKFWDLGLKFNHLGTFLLRGARPYGHGQAYIIHVTGALSIYRLEYINFILKMWGLK